MIPTPEAVAQNITSIESRPVIPLAALAECHDISPGKLETLLATHFALFPGELCFTPDASRMERDCGLADFTAPVFTEAGALMVGALLARRSPGEREPRPNQDNRLNRSIVIARAFHLHRTARLWACG